MDWQALAIVFDRDRSVVIDMVAVDIMQMTIVHVIKVIAMRHHHMAIAGTMHVPLMSNYGLCNRIGVGDLQHMLVDMTVMNKVQVAIVQIIPMIDMPHFGVPTIFTMYMRMIVMDRSSVIINWRSGTPCHSDKSDEDARTLKHWGLQT